MKRSRVKIPIFMYHHIGEAATDEDKPLFVSAERFKEQMRFLCREKYETISLEDMADAFRSGKPLPPKPIIITFDDGTETIYRNALPVLQAHDFKAAVFLTINYIERKDLPERSFSKLSPLTWEEIKEMQERGISFYPHSLTHPRLTQVAREEAYFEIKESRNILESRLNKKTAFFAYPHGDRNGEVEEMVKKAGYEGALLAWGGINREDADMYALKRMAIYDDDTDLRLKLKLAFGEDKVTVGFLTRYYCGRIIKRWI